MDKISFDLYVLNNKRLFYVSILISLTTGRVTASFTMFGVINKYRIRQYPKIHKQLNIYSKRTFFIQFYHVIL
ncbi:hypothetical protein Ahy_B06g082213 [Arachis hypogaea]|uniref:Uncharacterized protein n=1 Tax=Arachis hypogaea TaxID=3818 RepID=A0A444YN03_ARAHY|nr:hypothetical protein Ahy_B06g082213 [Arachis hypogaea]